MQYLYQLHHKNRTSLVGEPKVLAPSALNGFRVSARHARESILGFNGILWVRGEGCVEQGEEAFDLGIDNPTNSNSTSIPQGESRTATA